MAPPAFVPLLAVALAASPQPGPTDLVHARPGAAPALVAAGARPVAPQLRIWRVSAAALPRLRGTRAVDFAEPNRRLAGNASSSALDEPLASTEWWRAVIGADAAPAPGPGKPVTLVDSGVDMTHPEFAHRPNTTMLNEQQLVLDEDDHGTEVASVIGAPVNGMGIAGVYPQAVLRSWDASPLGFITTAAAVRGIVAAANGGPGVINISFGGESPDRLIENAVLYAFRRGSLVVASAGNDGLSGNALSYPASYAHVLTVAATQQSGTVTGFSSESPDVDLAAPGDDITVAEPTSYDSSGYLLGVSGTSFSAPMVSGAAAWVWTVRPELDNTQLFDVMRFSAHDLAPTGFDQASGFGMLNIPAALTHAAPARDPLEPNDDIDEVKLNAIFTTGEAPVTTAAHLSATLRGRVDRHEDPQDVYRAYVPSGGSLTAQTSGGAVGLRIFRSRAVSIDTARPAAARTTPGPLKVRNATGRGAYFYVDVFPRARVTRTSYALRVSATARP